jgi:V/A-type H+-transporting ATPase subunit I
MAIVKMNSFNLLTFEQFKSPLLKALQKFQQVHFKRLSPEDYEITMKRNAENTGSYENELARVVYAAGRLKPFADLPSGIAALKAPPREMTFEELDGFTGGFDYGKVCDEVASLDERIKAAQAELARVRSESDNLRQWSGMDIAPSEIDRLKSVRYSFGTVNKNSIAEFSAHMSKAYPAAYIEQLHTVKDDVVIFVTAAADEWEAFSVEIKNSGFTRMTLNFNIIPADKVKENDKRVNQLNDEADKAAEGLKALAVNYTELNIAADYFRACLERARACDNFMNLGQTLVIQGWYPQDVSEPFKQLLEKATNGDYYLEESAVEKDSNDVPITLRNNKIVTAFEDVTAMFSLPRYNELDPTPILMPFYWLFFGIMVGDAGYGLLLIVGTFLALKFLHFKPGMQKFLKFFNYLGYSTVLAGLLFGSFFGFPIPFMQLATAVDPVTGQIVNKSILSSDYDITTMLIISIAIGFIQIFFALGVKAYMLFRDGKPLAAFMDAIAWIITLVVGVLLLLSGIGILPLPVVLMRNSLFGCLIFLAATSGRGNKTIVGKVAGGIFDVYGLTSYIGDLVSYTRLVALALSGGYIAFAFNKMGMEVIPEGFARIIFGSLVVVVGGAINMGLALLGAYVHTCRLQYVEFFGKFYEGGGVPFKPLSPQNAFVQIKKLS